MLKSSLLSVSTKLSHILKHNIKYSTSSEKIQQEIYQNVSPFYLFPSPTVVTPTFELIRFIGNTISRAMYYKTEPQYTDHKFINGSKNAIYLMAKGIREQDNNLISNLVLRETSMKLFDRLKDFPKELLRKKFLFEKENIIHAFVHSSTISPNKAFNLELNQMTYFSTVIAVIDPNSTEQLNLPTALNRIHENTLFCNVTLCRQFYAEGLWKISHINFFDKHFYEMKN